MAEQDITVQTKTLGLDRWVQGTYLVAAVFLLWLLDKVATMIWRLLSNFWTTLPQAESIGIYITVGSALTAAALLWKLYTNESVNRLVREVVSELSKVTWPTRREVQTSTIVVVITSIIASLILGSFDAIWSAVTDLIYKV